MGKKTQYLKIKSKINNVKTVQWNQYHNKTLSQIHLKRSKSSQQCEKE